ncbi:MULTISPECIES: alpha/beta fold hydrolase [unclassified Kaistella]|uniref:alpha/beta fold hydrolase n=1 Tax=unclassified Kaistella TaxID=2762626 RepID=UPI00273755AA|nr:MULTISPECIES: alpha/beta fold hydrolase [unclassified Kaistella]MDP2454393.1 alpha/beta fold hydrolase [Kaistella sp. SH11-4b]MDP2457880.1 alpha/beta fold hydrolase [Kaistella sp. SH40-3]MDP2460786.1 alpha/beta fold hydrolase [Kaistella sp. SH19-2b]
MKTSLQHITLKKHQLVSGKILDIDLSYQLFGPELHSVPIVLVNHAFTGNSNVTGENGWWNSIIGENKIIDTNTFSVICFNIPGNGFDGSLIKKYQDFTPKDIATIFLQGLSFLNISKLHTLIGGSLGGAIGWEMLAINTDLAENFIPVACDYKTSDWLHAQCLVQQFLLDHPIQPLQKARVHAMLCYRTPASLNERFKNEIHPEKKILNSHDWLKFHGEKLNERFSLDAYRLMNHLLMTINTDEKKLENIKANIHFIGVDSDLFFPAFEMRKCQEFLKQKKSNIFYHEIKSIHGHDAFLMEYGQLNQILNTIIHEK